MSFFRNKFHYLIFLFLLSCQTVSHSSTADEILDVSTRKVYNFLLENKKLLEHKKVLVLPFYIYEQGEKDSIFGIYLAKSLTGLIRGGDNFLLGDSRFLSMFHKKITFENFLKKVSTDFVLVGEILVRDVTFEVIVKLLDKNLFVIRSYSFIMPLNDSVLKYLRSCKENVDCMEKDD